MINPFRVKYRVCFSKWHRLYSGTERIIIIKSPELWGSLRGERTVVYRSWMVELGKALKNYYTQTGTQTRGLWIWTFFRGVGGGPISKMKTRSAFFLSISRKWYFLKVKTAFSVVIQIVMLS